MGKDEEAGREDLESRDGTGGGGDVRWSGGDGMGVSGGLGRFLEER